MKMKFKEAHPMKKRKRGRRGGVYHRLRKFNLNDRRKSPPLPPVLLLDVQSIRNKVDKLEAQITVGVQRNASPCFHRDLVEEV